MDELNQIQNPNIPPPADGPTGPTSPMMPQVSMKKKGPWLWVIIGIVAAVAGLAWWYINNMTVQPVVQQQPVINQEAREDISIGNEIKETDLGNLDKEFQAIDSDLNSL